MVIAYTCMSVVWLLTLIVIVIEWRNHQHNCETSFWGVSVSSFLAIKCERHPFMDCSPILNEKGEKSQLSTDLPSFLPSSWADYTRKPPTQINSHFLKSLLAMYLVIVMEKATTKRCDYFIYHLVIYYNSFQGMICVKIYSFHYYKIRYLLLTRFIISDHSLQKNLTHSSKPSRYLSSNIPTEDIFWAYSLQWFWSSFGEGEFSLFCQSCFK